ncbi:MAG: hypothetical protein JXQ75_18175 [Phycisphaerae bacterium]|nr:hypothetical protein [Phycisphaerae bacterium]
MAHANGLRYRHGVTGIGDLISSILVGWLWAGFGIKVGVMYALVLMIAGAGFMLYLAGGRVDQANHD